MHVIKRPVDKSPTMAFPGSAGCCGVYATRVQVSLSHLRPEIGFNSNEPPQRLLVAQIILLTTTNVLVRLIVVAGLSMILVSKSSGRQCSSHCFQLSQRPIVYSFDLGDCSVDFIGTGSLCLGCSFHVRAMRFTRRTHSRRSRHSFDEAIANSSATVEIP